MLRQFAARILVASTVVFASVLPAHGQERPTVPSERYESVHGAESVPTAEMPSVESDVLELQNEERTGRVDPHRYGTVVRANLTPTRDGIWERLPSGDWLWRLRLRSDGATSLSLGFPRFELPEGAQLYVHDESGTTRGPYTAADATDGQHWTPIVHGDEITIELQVPDNRRGDVRLDVGRVVHGFRSIRPTVRSSSSTKSGSCNLDVACQEATPWSKQVRSVGVYSYVYDGTAYLCSGSLVNNTAENKTPYFLTAEHCVSGPDVASTMVFYWNYQNPTCRSRGTSENGERTDDPRDDQTSSGAILRARYGNYHDQGTIRGKSDLALVEVDDEIPKSYALYFSGWSRQGDGASRGVTIHHPAGHGKRISFDDDPLTKTAYGESGGGDTHLRVGDWDLGTTEGGSSGAPLYDTDQNVVGVLSGGFAGCETGSADDNDLPDWYGRVAPGFQNGDYEGNTLADWLDPLDTGADTLGGLPQADNVDITSPAPIEGLRIDDVQTSDRTITLEWIATGDDNRRGVATAYDLRYDTTRIETQSDFESAHRITDVISPDRPGTVERFEVDDADGLKADRSYYFALVAIDDFGNRSARASTTREVVLVKDIEIGPGGVQTRAGGVSETRFVLNRTQDVRITLYDLLGRRVKVLFDERVEEGFERVVQFETGGLASGPYFVRFTGETFATTRKIVVVH